VRHFGKVEPGRIGLVNIGPLVNVIVKPMAGDAAEASETPEAELKMMIDTGAQTTVIDESIPRELNLRPIRYIPIIGVNGNPVQRPVYPMSVSILMADDQRQEAGITVTMEMVGAPIVNQGQQHRGLLGRDFLSHFIFEYVGPNGTFELRPGKALARRLKTIAKSRPAPNKNAAKRKRKKQRRK